MIKNLLKTVSLATVFIAGALSSHAQIQHVCGFDELNDHLLNTNQDYRAQIEEMNRGWVEYLQNKNNPRKIVVEDSDTIYEIPVVIHVIHTGGAIGSMYNRSDDDLIEWVNYTNQVFAGTAPGYVGEGAGGANIPVRLVLAKRTPTCDSTNGIIRIDASANSTYVASGVANGGSGITQTSLFEMSRWNSAYYYNIYVVNRINGADGYGPGSFTAGFAYLPPAAAHLDGSVMLSSIAETGESTFAHEMGHAFGLYHTFQGTSYTSTTCPPAEDGTTCMTLNDMVCDTEVSLSAFGVWPCPTSSDINPCTGLPYAGVQYNVMNYGYCSDRFTPGQRDRVIYILNTYRSSLINSLGGEPLTESIEVLTSACVPPNSTYPFYASGPIHVELETLSHSSSYVTSASNSYQDFTSNSCLTESTISIPQLSIGDEYTLTITTDIYEQHIKAYIDYNNDGVFNETDEVIVDSLNAPIGANTFNFTVPLTAVVDENVRMRIRTEDYEGVEDITGCNTLTYGQTEDYTVRIVSEPLSQNDRNFKATVGQCVVNLNWDMTDPRYSIATIELEKSTDGRHFNTIENFAIGKKNDIRSYTDLNINTGTVFYRLKVTNSASKVTYSAIEKVETSCQASLAIYPNPSQGKFSVQFSASLSEYNTISVYNVIGMKVAEKSVLSHAGLNTVEMDLSSYANGVYYVSFSNSTSTQQASITINK